MSKKYNIGIDFGTSQTKVCIWDFQDKHYTFHKFKKSNSYLFPSTIEIKNDSTFLYGESADKSNLLRFFKMAALIDENFISFANSTINNLSRNNENIALTYDSSVFNISNLESRPELACVFYLAYVILDVRNEYISSPDTKPDNAGSWIGELIGRTDNNAAEFIYSIGIPTEYDQAVNIKRRIKYFTILYLAIKLADTSQDSHELEQKSLLELIKIVEGQYQKIIDLSSQQLNEVFNATGIQVLAETSAGLAFLNSTKSEKPGKYATLDVGAGTTDLSFFEITDDYKIHYYASESISIASNSIFAHYIASSDYQKVAAVQKEYWEGLFTNDDELDKAQYVIRAVLTKGMTNVFTKRVIRFLKYSGINKSFNDRVCLTYGGGSRFPCFSKGDLYIFDNGKSPNPTFWTMLNLRKINSNVFSALNITNQKEDIEAVIDFLIIALGLAMTKPGNEPHKWIEMRDYHNANGVSNRIAHLISHPMNEDMYLYDVLLRKWNKNF